MPRTLTPEELDALKQDVLKSISPDTPEEEFNRVYPAKMAQAMSVAQSQPPAQGNPIGRFAAGVAETANPIAAAKGLYQTVRHPLNAIAGIMEAANREAEKVKASPTLLGQIGHEVGVLPVIGPAIVGPAEKMASGDVAGGLGQYAGMAATLGAPGILGRLRVAPGSRASRVLQTQANDIVAQKVLAPTNRRYQGQASWLGPNVLEEVKGGVIPKNANREELRAIASEQASRSANVMDAATDATGRQAPVTSQTLLARFDDTIRSLQDRTGAPMSAEAALRIRELAQQRLAIQANAGRAGMIPYDELKKIRDHHADIAERADAYARQPGGPPPNPSEWASGETAAFIRESLAARNPEAAAAAKEYAKWKTLQDTLDPVMGRPRATALSEGMTGGARVSGAMAASALELPKWLGLLLSQGGPMLRQRRMQPGSQLRRAVRLSEQAHGELPPGLEWLGRLGLATGVGGALAPDEPQP